MIYNFIMCAGKQTRFESELPKALMPYKDSTILQSNIDFSLQYCDKVVVVASLENYSYFEKFKSDNVDVIKIQSGFGCGDAVLRALSLYYTTSKDTCFIMWGDSIQNDKKVFIQSLLKYRDNIIIPVVYEKEPYVQIRHSHFNACKVYFTKYGEHTHGGWHDLSIFFGSCNILRSNLFQLRNKLWKKDHYEHKHNNEMLFLDMINEVPGNYKIVIIEDHKDLSFNTLEQYNNLVENLQNSNMKSGDVLYYVDRGVKFYFDVKLLEIQHLDEYNTDLYRCEILYNNYKFNTEAFKPNPDLKGKIDTFTKLVLVRTKEEAEKAIL